MVIELKPHAYNFFATTLSLSMQFTKNIEKLCKSFSFFLLFFKKELFELIKAWLIFWGGITCFDSMIPFSCVFVLPFLFFETIAFSALMHSASGY